MGLTRLVKQVQISSGGDVLLEIFRYKLQLLPIVKPDIVQGCDLLEGEWGTLGSIITLKYTHEGTNKVAKMTLSAIDEERNLITFKVLGGDLMELYKSFQATIQVDKNVVSCLVTWTLEYEKLNEAVPSPDTYLDLALMLTKGIETSNVSIPN